ncbi:MAG: BTAD domain-containing putative transcriptional regulator, partial [Armatimonadota bacterium]
SLWQIHLLGGLRLERGAETITRFRSQKFGALLAYLSLFPQRLHSREELAELFWPETDPELARGNLRAALSSLRRQLEPPGDPAGSFFITDGRTHLHLNRDALRTDVAAFEAALLAASRTSGDAAARHLSDAVAQYAGPLMPGCYESWALSERDRLAEAYLRALHQLSDLKERAGDGDLALDYARRSVSADPLREESHAAVIRLLMKSGQTAAAKRQFDELTRVLREHYDSEPAALVKALLNASVTPARNSAPAPVLIAAPAVEPAPALTRVSEPAGGERLVPSLPEQTIPQHFPVLVTRFFGREEEIAALGSRFAADDTRLVTITGPGGSGKTRIAAETARGLGASFPGGIWFVPLVDVREADRLPEALAAALGLSAIRGGAQTTPLLTQVAETLLAATASGRALLVLDNFEQLAETASGQVTELLYRVPNLRCLVTSRQRLRVEPEREFPLLPLAVPEFPGTPERLLEFSSVQLFVSRAQSARADFQLTGRNAAAVGSLCAQLEGMPLAIELAAAWMSVLTPSQMLGRMNKRLDLLVSRRRDVSPRHRTLRAAIESSVALLPPEVREFFASLSVFRGGWTLEAAEAVCIVNRETGEGEGTFGAGALEYLTELADHSLVVRAEDRDADSAGSEGARFRMLETLREFAHELQSEAPDETERLRERHARWSLAFAEEAAPCLLGSDQVGWLHRLQADHDNLREALGYLLEHDVEAELRLAAALFRFWQSRGPIREAHDWLEKGLERDAAGAGRSASPAIRAQALECSGTLAWYRSDLAGARARLEESIALYRSLGDGVGVARSINSFAGMQNIADNPESARVLLEEGLAEMEALGGPEGAKGRQILLESLTRDAVIRDDRVTAKRYGAEFLRLARASGDHHLIAAALTWESFAAINAQDYSRAQELLTESLAITREVNEALYLCSALWGLGYIALFEGDVSRAMGLHRDALRTIAGLTGYDFSIVHIITALAMDALQSGQPDHAARLLGAGDMLRQRLGYPLAPVLVKVDVAKMIADTRNALGESAFTAAYSAGSGLTTEEAIQEALRESFP